MTRPVLILRRGVQALSFLFLLYLILQTAFPLELKIPVDLYLRLDPFIGIISLLGNQRDHPEDASLPSASFSSSSSSATFSAGGSAPWGRPSISSTGSSSGRRSGRREWNDQPLRRLRYGILPLLPRSGSHGLAADVSPRPDQPDHPDPGHRLLSAGHLHL